MAGRPEDEATAKYVAQKFRDAGLDTEIVEYKVWINYPLEISVDITAPDGVEMHGPTREHVDGDALRRRPASGDAVQRHVAVRRCRGGSGLCQLRQPEDFEKLEKLKIDVRGKIVLVRYGQKLPRGERSSSRRSMAAAGVIIYSDPYERRLAAWR